MNYAQAVARLAKPRNQLEKKIGHKLQLYYEGSPDGLSKNILLRYFNTDIITWYPDGGVRIGAEGFWDSRCTLEKINEYTPRGWRMQMHNLQHAKHMVCASVTIRTDTWEFVRSMPYEDSVKLYEGGRADHKGSPLESVEACHIVDSVAATVKESVMAFLYGELRRPDIHEDLVVLDNQEMMGIVDRSQARTRICVEMAKAKTAQPALVWGVIDTMWKTSFRMNQLQLYDPAVYALTGKPKSAKERVAQMEHFMRVGNNHTRYAKNSEEFHGMKRDLMAECEVMLLRELGFEVKERERRERSRQ